MRTVLVVLCQECEAEHEATPSHMSEHGQGQIYAVVCTDGLTDYYTGELLIEREVPEFWLDGVTS